MADASRTMALVKLPIPVVSLLTDKTGAAHTGTHRRPVTYPGKPLLLAGKGLVPTPKWCRIKGMTSARSVVGPLPRRSHRAAALGAALVWLLVACSGNGEAPGRRSGLPGPPPVVYVAVGASETAGVGADLPEQGWPEVLRRAHLPDGTAYTNLGIPGATVAQAIEQELPRALSLQPTLVTVWLNVNDLVAGVAPPTYESQLGQLVRALRRGGATKVLVANTPPLELLPAYVDCRRPQPARRCPFGPLLPPPALVSSAVGDYNAAIKRVADAEGAVLVDLHAAALRQDAKGALAPMVSRDGFHPSTLGHRAVADTFGEAL